MGENEKELNEFAIRLKLLRERHGIKQIELANIMGVTRGQLHRYENGMNDITRTLMLKVCEYFNVTLDWLAGEGNREPIGYRNNNAEDIIEKIKDMIK